MRFLIQIVLLFLVVSAVLTIIRAAFSSTSPRQPARRPPGPAATSSKLVKDPVCGTYIPESTAVRAENEFFCSEECRAKYLKQGAAG